MNRRLGALFALVFSAICFSPFDVLAYRQGADPGVSGGPAGSGQTCIACHEEIIGTGSAEILGAPANYSSGAIYDLTVRVADADMFGAGFQISVETVAGHIGDLLLTDVVNTQYLSGDSNYVTHTLAGVENSIAEWSSQGGQYEFSLQWRAPISGSETATVYVAALAINDAQAFLGDHMYLASETIPSAAVPTVSAWGMLLMALSLATVGTLVLRRTITVALDAAPLASGRTS